MTMSWNTESRETRKDVKKTSVMLIRHLMYNQHRRCKDMNIRERRHAYMVDGGRECV